MYSDAAFLKNIAKNPSDDFLRSVYADWLEEQGDDRADFLRLQLQAKSVRRGSTAWSEIQHQLTEARKHYTKRWLTRVDRVFALRKMAHAFRGFFEGRMEVPCLGGELEISIKFEARNHFPCDQALDALVEILDYPHDLRPVIAEALFQRISTLDLQQLKSMTSSSQFDVISSAEDIWSVVEPVTRLELNDRDAFGPVCFQVIVRRKHGTTRIVIEFQDWQVGHVRPY